MYLKNSNMSKLLQGLGKRKLICFGAGDLLKECCASYDALGFIEQVAAIVDNDKDKWGAHIEWHGIKRPVISPEELLILNDEVVLIITCARYWNIYSQLQNIPEFSNADCYIFTMMRIMPEPYVLPTPNPCNQPKIPKKIHYCWFGGADIPLLLREYMKSWKKYCPEYEIIRWDESNYDVFKHPYMAAAYKEKKWGFASDWARLDIIYEHGGVYFDTDVELLRNIDNLLDNEAFCGFEFGNLLAFGLGFGAAPHNSLIKEIRDMYDTVYFYKPDGSLDLTPCTIYQTDFLEARGLRRDNTIQLVDGMRIYPTDVFCPLNDSLQLSGLTENTYSIHHYDTSWWNNEQKSKRTEEILEIRAALGRGRFVNGDWQLYGEDENDVC